MFTVTTTSGKTYKISFRYFNYESDSNGEQIITHCIIQDDNRNLVGMAFCHPKDVFSKKLGRKIALTRAIHNFKLSKEDRTDIWNAYFERHKK